MKNKYKVGLDHSIVAVIHPDNTYGYITDGVTIKSFDMTNPNQKQMIDLLDDSDYDTFIKLFHQVKGHPGQLNYMNIISITNDDRAAWFESIYGKKTTPVNPVGIYDNEDKI